MHPVFSNESSLPKALDKQTPIRDGSIGINEVLGYIKNEALKGGIPKYTNIIISIFTLSRNVYKKDISISQFRKDLIGEIMILLIYLQAYAESFQNSNKKFLVTFYFPDYSNLPKTIRRPLNLKEQEMKTFYESSISYVRKSFHNHITLSTIHLTFLDAGTTKHLPYKSIAHWLKTTLITQGQTLRYSMDDPVLLLSHCPLDFYLHTKVKSLETLECFTAVIRTPKTFGDKLVKGIRLPFIWEIHRAVGDSTLVLPYDKKKRKLLIERSIENKWWMRQRDYILKDILSVLGISSKEYLFYLP